MASLEQWSEWRDDYLLEFRMTIDESAYEYTRKSLENNKVEFNEEKTRRFICEAIGAGYLDQNDPAYLIKFATFCLYYCTNKRRFSSYHAKDANDDYKLSVANHNDIISAFKNYTAYINGTYWFMFIPFINAIGFCARNHPIAYRELLLHQLDLGIDLSYCRLTMKQLFDYYCSMTQYGLYKLLVDSKVQHAEDLFETVQKRDYEGFLKICNDYTIDFTNVSETCGFFLNGQVVNIVDDDIDTFLSKSHSLLSMIGLRECDFYKDVFPKIYNHQFICSVLPFELSEQETSNITIRAYNLSVYLPYVKLFDNDELNQITKVIESPYFVGFMKIVQYVRLSLAPQLPKGIQLVLSPEETARFLPHINIENVERPVEKDFTLSKLTSNEGLDTGYKEPIRFNDHQSYDNTVSNEKTLSSRWMTEPYHRMQDNTLVELVSKNIWPKLISEVDGLKWAPSKRSLQSFPKVKNQLAACILFHALELAKIAKLPKNEESDYSYEGLYGEEDRVSAGVVSTSKLRAGITSTKRKYNDTLPLGYMAVLEKFIPESELPGRTTSRTYLKLLNKWIKIRYEDTLDRMDSEATAILLVSECKTDLGPQFYLFQDNKARMKSILKEWKDALPDLFNIPI